MNAAAKKRSGKIARNRCVLGVFLLAWLNVAAQPCLMAMEMAPDMQVAAEESTLSSADHDAKHEQNRHCGGCPPAVAEIADEGCLTMRDAACGLIADIGVDARPAKSQLKDIPAVVAIAYSPPEPVVLRPVAINQFSPGNRLRFADSPPLCIQNCVFLK